MERTSSSISYMGAQLQKHRVHNTVYVNVFKWFKWIWGGCEDSAAGLRIGRFLCIPSVKATLAEGPHWGQKDECCHWIYCSPCGYFYYCFVQLLERWEKCLAVKGKYFEGKWNKFHVCLFLWTESHNVLEHKCAYTFQWKFTSEIVFHGFLLIV